MKKSSSPLVSVVIPTFNRLDLLPKAIKSVQQQTFKDFEIIVVDDGVDERAEKMVQNLHDDRIRYIAHETNRGCSAAKNTGIKHARGKYVAFLDDDDVFLLEKLARQVASLEDASRDVGFSFTASYEIYDDRTYTKASEEGVDNYLELALRNFSAIIDSSMLYKREVFETVGVLDETFPTHTGAEFIIRVAKHFRGVGINQPLIQRLMLSEHMQMGSNIHNRIRGRMMLLERYKEDFAHYPTFLAKHLTQLAKFYRMERAYTNARKNFYQAMRLQFTWIRFMYWLSMFGQGLLYRVFRKVKKTV